MANLFKKKYTKIDKATGKRISCKTKVWWCKYRDANGVEHRESVCVRDKGAAQARLNIIVRRVENEKAGIIDAGEAERSVVLRAAIGEQVDAYAGYLKNCEVSDRHFKESLARLKRMLSDCHINRLLDIQPDRIRNWLDLQTQQDSSARTRNTYLASLRAFVHWCIKEGKMPGDPLATLNKANEALDVRRERRALLPEQLGILLEVAQNRPLHEIRTIRTGKNRGKPMAKVGESARKHALEIGWERALVYQTAAQTGLRRNELRQLQWGDLHIDDTEHPHIVLRVGANKAKRADVLPLRADLVEKLKHLRPEEVRHDDKVFSTIPSMNTLRRDLEAAGIPYEDEYGRVADFHALRHTFGTMLSTSGVSPRVAQSLMRHSDIKLTMNTYTDPKLLNLKGAVDMMPELAPPKETNSLKATGTCDINLTPNLAPTASISSQKQSSGDTLEGNCKPVSKGEKRKVKSLSDIRSHPQSPPDKKASGRIRTDDHPLTRRELYH